MRAYLLTWAGQHPYPASIIGAVVLLLAVTAVWCALRAVSWPSAAVLVASVGAAGCTAYSADTSWRFAEHRLGMDSVPERIAMFAAAEIALLACGLLARANKTATASNVDAGSPGVPGTLMWAITCVQIIPALTESGPIAGPVRAFFGPIMAALLWHQVMGLEIRLIRPGALSQGLPALMRREARQRLLSYLGLAVRDRDAAQISRDRATDRAVRLASRRRLGLWGRARLAAAVARSGAATPGPQQYKLMQALAGRRTSGELRTVPLDSPWIPEPAPEVRPRTLLGVTGAALRAMDPLAAVHLVHSAHPYMTPAALASLCTECGVPVTESMVRVATRAGNAPRTPAPEDAQEVHPVLPAAPVPEVHSDPTAPAPNPAPVDVPVPNFILDLPYMERAHPDVCAPAPVAALTRTRRQVHAAVPAAAAPESAEADPLLEQARDLAPGSIPSLRQLKSLGIGQARAQRIQAALTTTAS